MYNVNHHQPIQDRGQSASKSKTHKVGRVEAKAKVRENEAEDTEMLAIEDWIWNFMHHTCQPNQNQPEIWLKKKSSPGG